MTSPNPLDAIAAAMKAAALNATDVRFDTDKRIRAHIAASNPANVLALIEAYEALTAENSQLRQWYAEGLASMMSERDEVTASRDAALALLSEAGETLKPFAGVVGPLRAETDAGRHWLPDEDFRRARDLSARIAAKLKEGT